jgi:3-methylfumaryl-CoA hydratase
MVNQVPFEDLAVGDLLPEREHTASNVSLFMYNAAVWNAHRIHYDEIYAKGIEGHPGVVIDGPLQGDWLSQVALNWLLGQGELMRFSYTNRRATYLGETLVSGGLVSAVDRENRLVEVSLFIKNEQGEVVTPGEASLRFF